MSTPVIEVRLDDCDASGNEWRVKFTVTSKSTAPIFLAQDRRLPLLRMAADGTTVEIWQGVPPPSPAELNRDINALILPGTVELAPGAVVSKIAVVKWPLKQSGYWLEESEEIAMALPHGTSISVLVIQGFGLTPLDPRRVRSIDELLAWQSTARSQVVTCKIPAPVP